MKLKSTRRVKREGRTKPKFRRSESWKFKRLKASWRFPHGIDNKMRHQTKGFPPKVKIGYRSPSTGRGLHPSGFETVIVYSPEDITLVDRNHQIITIARTIGAKKKAKIIERAREWAIRVTNPGLGPKALEEALELEFDEQELAELAELEGLDDLEDLEDLEEVENDNDESIEATQEDQL